MNDLFIGILLTERHRGRGGGSLLRSTIEQDSACLYCTISKIGKKEIKSNAIGIESIMTRKENTYSDDVMCVNKGAEDDERGSLALQSNVRMFPLACAHLINIHEPVQLISYQQVKQHSTCTV